MFLSVRLKIILIVVIVVFASIGVNTLMNASFFGTEYTKAMQENELVIGQNIKVQLDRLTSLGIPIENMVGFSDQLSEVTAKYDYISYAMVLDNEGEILFSSNMRDIGKVSDDITGHLNYDTDTVVPFSRDGKNYYDAFIPVMSSGVRAATIRLGFTTSIIDEKTGAIYSYSVGIALLSFAIAVGLIYVLVSAWVSRPFGALMKALDEMKKNGIRAVGRINKYSNDELGSLTDALNELIERQKMSEEEIRKHAEALEEKVRDRTKVLDEKISEMTETKTALLNMMEDSDDTNKNLVVTQGQLKQSMTKLEEIDAKKDQFISIAAHELKTPLTSIHGFSQLLQDEKILSNKEKREKYLAIIDNETNRLAHLVTDILDLSRVDLGTIKLMPSDIDVNETISDVQKEMNVQIAQKGLQSEYIIEKNLPKIFNDKERFIQIMMNLINNSVKYTPKGRITVKAARERDFIHISVKDTGIGISKENQNRIFERFYQVDSSYTRKTGGTGLGLSLCKEFITLMGGKIWFESDLGKGSEFHFTVPLRSGLKAPKK